jgi:hypothetical protein
MVFKQYMNGKRKQMVALVVYVDAAWRCWLALISGRRTKECVWSSEGSHQAPATSTRYSACMLHGQHSRDRASTVLLAGFHVSKTVELWSSQARGATGRDERLGVVESGSADWTRRLVCSRKRDEGHVCSYICRHVRPSLSPWRARAQLEAAGWRVNLELDLRIGKEANWLQQGPMLQLDTSEHQSWLAADTIRLK